MRGKNKGFLISAAIIIQLTSVAVCVQDGITWATCSVLACSMAMWLTCLMPNDKTIRNYIFNEHENTTHENS